MVMTSLDPCVKRLQKLMRHIDEVRDNCEILGAKLIEAGEGDVGRILIAGGYQHDFSKFEGIEWDHLWDKDDPLFFEAWQHHVKHNDHHPEFWGGIQNMSRPALAHCVCDWKSRSSEFGSDLRLWIDMHAVNIFHFKPGDTTYQTITEFLDLLLEKPF